MIKAGIRSPVKPPVRSGATTNTQFCGGIDFDPRFCHAPPSEFAIQDRFLNDCGPFGPRQTGGHRKAISYQLLTTPPDYERRTV